MHRAKVFLTVSVGIFLLALSYHLGALPAAGEEPGRVACAAIGQSVRFAVVDRLLYVKYEPSRSSPAMRPQPVRVYVPVPIPGTSRVVACGEEGVVLENGEIWSCRRKGFGSEAWRLEGSF